MKCVHCGRRKGKRGCPLLGADICPACCAEVRAERRRCPESCPFLAASESYQAQRRKEKILAHGGAYIDERLRIFSDEEDLEAVGEIEHIVYLWERSRGRASDEEIARAYEGLATLRGTIAIVGEAPHPLASLLHEIIDGFPHCGKLAGPRIVGICRSLARLARAAGAEGGQNSERAYLERLESYHRYIDWTPVSIPPARPGSGGSGSRIIIPS